MSMINENQDACTVKYENIPNIRIHERIFPSHELQPNFDPRPVSTKYSLFMTNEQHTPTTVPLRNYSAFTPKDVFYTGNSNGPVQHALQQVDIDSLLGNRFMALQKNDHAFYIPPFTSDLYKHTSNLKNAPKNHEQEIKVPFNENKNPCNYSPLLFNNSSRHNIKNIPFIKPVVQQITKEK